METRLVAAVAALPDEISKTAPVFAYVITAQLHPRLTWNHGHIAPTLGSQGHLRFLFPGPKAQTCSLDLCP